MEVALQRELDNDQTNLDETKRPMVAVDEGLFQELDQLDRDDDQWENWWSTWI